MIRHPNGSSAELGARASFYGARRGWPDERLRKLSRGNFLRVWRAVERAAADGNGAAGERRRR